MARYAFFVGVNQYNDKNINPLKCAERDARRLASLFEHKLGFKASYLEERSAEDIEERITRLGEGLRPADTFVFYFAGHGKAVADEQYFLLPRANLGNLVNGTGRLSFRSLKALTSQPAWRGVSRVFIFDACRSELESGARGGATPKFKGEAILRDVAFASTASVESPLVLINACSENQCAIEVIGDDGEGHGIFSSALAAEIAGGQLTIDDRLGPRLAAQMQHILAGHGQDRVQHPMICGALPVVLSAPLQAAAAEMGDARRVTDERLWRLACVEDSVEAYKEYLGNRDIDCLHEDEALGRIKALRAAEKPKGPSAEELAEAERQKADESAWLLAEEIVRASNSLEAKVAPYRAYADKWQAQRGKALKRITDLEQQIKQAEAQADEVERVRQEKDRAEQAWLELQAQEQQRLAQLRREEEEKQYAEAERKLQEAASERNRREEEARRNDPRSFKPSRAGEAVPKLCAEAPEMVAIPPGKFLMGSDKAEQDRAVATGAKRGRFECENPRHSVQIGYWLAAGQYAVTFEEWDRFATETKSHKPSDQGWGRGNRPVINVSWEDAKAYVKWLNGKAGLIENSPNRYRLLSEAEWEYACRAGSSTAFSWGESIDTNRANYDGAGCHNGGAKGDYRQQTVPVDSFEPNAWGLYQMHGNVWEWVEDVGHGSYATGLIFKEKAPADGSAWLTGGDQSWRVSRGGSWFNIPPFLRSASRSYFTPSYRNDYVNFRLARTLT